MQLPLVGLRVVDAADGLGEFCGRLLADFGADVVRVEPPQGAASRAQHPLAPGGESLWFAHRNANKRGIAIDLSTVAGQSEFHELLAESDVFIESGKPGEFAAHSSDRHPRLISCFISACGQTGPYADFEMTDATLFAMSGWLTLSGTPDKPPLLFPGTLASDLSGIAACFAILTALIHRIDTGLGQHLDISAFEALTQTNSWQLPNMSAAVKAGNPPINQVRQGSGPLYPAHAAADGTVRVVCLSAKQWDGLWDWMGQPESFADPSWRDIVTRYINADVLNVAWAEFFADKPMLGIGVESQQRGCVIAPMLKPGDALSNEHYAARGTFTSVPIGTSGSGSDLGSASFVTGLTEIDGERAGYRSPAPGIDADRAAILAEWATPRAHSGADGPSPDSDSTASRQPLAGLRVIDFGHGGVGVEAGRMLADYGADVIKIENRDHPDFIRVVMGGETTPSFVSSSRNKRSFAVDIKSDDGCALVHELIKTADIIVENTSTGTMASMGVDYETVQQLNPGIVMSSSQLMGTHGPYKDWIGYGPTIQALAGLSWLWDFDDGDPPGGSMAIHPDHMTGRVVAAAALAGVIGRELRGGGMHAETAQVETLMSTLAEFFAAESLEPGSVRPAGNDSPIGAPWGAFPCAGENAWAVVCVRDDDDWERLRSAMGDPEWATDPSYATTAGRLGARGAVNHGVMDWTFRHTPAEVMEICQQHRVPGAAMLTALDHMSDPHLAARNFIVDIDQPGIGPIALEGPAFRGSAMPEPVGRPAPALGEHTIELATELGLSPGRIEELIAAGVLQA